MLTLGNVQTNQAGNYSVVITNAYGLTNSVIAMLSVVVTPPFITSQPTNQTVIYGSTATFRRDGEAARRRSIINGAFYGTNILNATNAILTLTNVQFSQAGNYRVLVTSPYGSTNSATATLTVNPPPSC